MIKTEIDISYTLTTRKLTLSYDKNSVVAGLDLAIPTGQMTALVGVAHSLSCRNVDRPFSRKPPKPKLCSLN